MRPSLPNRLKTARALAIITVAFGVVFYTIGDVIKPNYSSLTHFISELNASGTEWATQLGILGFLPLGLLFAAFLVVASPYAKLHGKSRVGWWLLWAQPIAFVGVVLFPCDIGCPVEGSVSQAAHNLISIVTYFAGALGIYLVSFAPVLTNSSVPKYFLRFAGIGFLLLFVIMLNPDLEPIRGAIQRGADALLAVSILLIAWHVLSDPSNRISTK